MLSPAVRHAVGPALLVGVLGIMAISQPASASDSPYLVNPCLDTSKPYHKQKWCDPTLDVEERITDMISRMTVAEKITSLDTKAGAIPSLGLPTINWWSEATHGISHVRNDASTPFESNVAFPITTAMSFNRSLWQATGAQIGLEARAFMNAGNAYSTYWAPVVNLAREPRWGRNIETPGEDPYLSGEYATAFVQGLQRNPADPQHLQASACCKHYAANSMENSTVAGVSWSRHNFSATVTQQDLVDSYMLPFQACVEKGQVSSLMCSYNAINGKPSCANDWLLTTVARNSWGFNGYITSDCDADADVFYEHHFAATVEETVRDVLRAGTDIDCQSFVGLHAQSALDKNFITEQDIDDRLRNLFRVRMRLSHFDPVGPLNKIPPSAVCSDEGREIARDGVRQGSTLLKNSASGLPLDSSKLGKIAVIGPNANLSKTVALYYGGTPCDNSYLNMVDAIEQYMPGKTVSALGVPSVSSHDTTGVAEAARMAAGADATVLVVGTDLTWGREGQDATSISFSSGQTTLIDAVAGAAQGKPVVVVTLTATPLDISSLLADDRITAILHVGQPSVQTFGVADVIFGARAPAGRTIQTIYPASYADEISIFDFNMRPGPSSWARPDCQKPDEKDCPRGTNPGRTHRFYTGQPVLPFGYGLSYTTFKYSVSASASTVNLTSFHHMLRSSGADRDGSLLSLNAVAELGAAVNYSVTVTNTGLVDADDVVLGFLAPPGAGTGGVPLQSLFGFERVHVPAGQSKTVYLYPSLAEFSTTDIHGRRSILQGAYRVWFGVNETRSMGMGFVETSIQAQL